MHLSLTILETIVVAYVVLIAIVLDVGSASNILRSTLNNTELRQSSNESEYFHETNPSKKLSRRKRYVAFPEGSSFSVSFFSNILTYCVKK